MSQPVEAVADYLTEAEARLALGQLDAAGIHAEVVSGDHVQSQFPLAFPAEEAYFLVVASEDAARARQALAQDATVPEGWEDEAECAIEGWICSGCDTHVSFNEAFCPECGASRGEVRAEDDDNDD